MKNELRTEIPRLYDTVKNNEILIGHTIDRTPVEKAGRFSTGNLRRDIIKALRQNNILHIHISAVLPRENITLFSAAAIINQADIMCRPEAEVIAHIGIFSIAICARIDKDRLIAQYHFK